MRDTPLDPHVGSEGVVRPQFVEELADRLRSEIRGMPSVDVQPTSTPRPPRRWPWAAGAAAAMVAVMLTATWATRPDRLVPAPSATDAEQPTAPPSTETASTVSPTTPTSPPTSPPASTPTLTPTPMSVPTTSTTIPVATRVSGLVVTVSNDRPNVIDLRDANGPLGSFDLGCPTSRTCTVQSAHVVGDTIWAAITDTGSDDAVDDIGSRVVSVSMTSGEIVEHLRLPGTSAAAVRSAGLGANGVLYAHVSDYSADRQLIAIENGTATVLATGVSGFRLSEDGHFLAVSFSNPPAGDQPRIEVTDLVDGATNSFVTDGINAGPGDWSPDGRHLIINEQWENGTAWVVDPWSDSPRPTAIGEVLDGACFVDARTIAHRTWDAGYAERGAQSGAVLLSFVDGGPPLATYGADLFGDALRCHPDGSITFLQRPLIEVDHGGGLALLEGDYSAPVDLIHIRPDGAFTTITSGPLRMA